MKSHYDYNRIDGFDQPMISVVIPVYNAERYLTEALESIRGQTFSRWECICIDDGSTDASPDILDRFAEMDSRFKVVHQSNSGCQVARNNALKMISSPWFLFMDADDIYHAKAFETLLRTAEDCDVDAVESGYCRCEEELSCDGDKELITDPIARMINDTKFRGEPWGRILKTSLFKRIQFVPGYHDDVKWMTTATMRMSNLAVVAAPMYFWRPVASSISNKPDYYKALPDLWKYQVKECPMLKYRIGVIAYSYFKIMPNIVSSHMLQTLRKDGVISFKWLSIRKRLRIFFNAIAMGGRK